MSWGNMLRRKMSWGERAGGEDVLQLVVVHLTTPPPRHAPSPPHCKQTPVMTGGKVDFALIREATRLELVKLLDSVHGTKVRRCLSAWCGYVMSL